MTKLQRLVNRLAALPPLTQCALWALYGAVGWGGLMTLLFCVFLHVEGNDPWKNIGFIGVTTFTAGGLFGALFGRSFVRKIRERITDQTG